MNSIKIFAPATVANVSCGFDALGFAINTIGDEMILTKTKEKGAQISKIEGAELTFDSSKNAASVVTMAMLDKANADFGVDMQLFKKVKPETAKPPAPSEAKNSKGVKLFFIFFNCF